MEKKYCAKIEGGDEIHVVVDVNGSSIRAVSWNVVGSLALIAAAKNLKSTFPSTVEALVAPVGNDAASLLVKELVLKIQNKWDAGDDDPEVCHCRKISQRSIERAIVLGAHTLEKVRKRTSANTGCGACMPDVLDLISKRVS